MRSTGWSSMASKFTGVFSFGEHPAQFLDAVELAMGNGNPVAYPGRSKPLSFQQNFEYGALLDICQFGREGRQLLQRLLFAVSPQSRNDGFRLQQVSKLHSTYSERSADGLDGILGIDPTDVAVFAPVHDAQSAMCAVAKQEHRNVREVEPHHGLAYRDGWHICG